MNWYYKNREERSKWIGERFHEPFSSSKTLLDVGCWGKALKKYIPKRIKYTGIDIAGAPDLVIDLDYIKKLPFPKNSFDAVVCTDVLEHLENIHKMFDELCRVSSKYVIITFPNPIRQASSYYRGKALNDNLRQGKYSKYYGLPLEKPEDRHRWFFSYDEAVAFVQYRASKNGFKVSVEETDRNYRSVPVKRKLIDFILRKVNPNLTIWDYIVMLEKK